MTNHSYTLFRNVQTTTEGQKEVTYSILKQQNI